MGALEARQGTQKVSSIPAVRAMNSRGERYGNARLFSGGRAGHQPDFPGEAAGLPGEVAAAVVGQPLDLDRQAVDPSDLCSTAATMRSRTSSPVMPLVVATKLMASRSQQSRAKATRTRSPLSQPISRPSEHQRVLRASTAMRPLVPALLAAGVALEQEPMHLHDAVDPRHVRRGPGPPARLGDTREHEPVDSRRWADRR